ncbi:MAG: DNA polymerase III subunit delta [Chloroflexi bacterium]|nr:DNA polymerase III subunit delta [Chloroflexota bacterium]MBT6680875.1 DNA polymerase III subunit delta [Chloroflexota bacterium]
MIRVLHGDDEFGIDETVRNIRLSLGEDAAESNTVEFEGRNFKPGEVEAAARTVPFLADRRLVLVRGLLRRLDATNATRGRGGAASAQMSSSGWEKFGELLAGLPDSTELVFVDAFPTGPGGKLRDNGGAFRALKSSDTLDISVFSTPRGRGVGDWIRNRVMSEDVQWSPSAIARLSDLVGPNLRLLDQEVRKLSLYAGDRVIQPDDVELMVAPAREANIFAAVDAILERRPGIAMKALYQLLDDGASVQYILSMLTRQTRMLILARHLREHGVDEQEIANRIGLRAQFALRKTIDQAGRFNHEYLAAAHRGLGEADLSYKSGKVRDRVALEMVVARLSGLR